MSELEVRLEELPRMWIASVRGYGQTPEVEAWRQLREWATSKALWGDFERHPVFGFNNPPPSSGSKEYGYELWIRLDAPEQSEERVECKEFEGGLFAVTTCRLQGDPDIATTWRMLWDWAQTSRYRWRETHELEKALNPDAPEDELVLGLYLPIAECGSAAAGVGERLIRTDLESDEA